MSATMSAPVSFDRVPVPAPIVHGKNSVFGLFNMFSYIPTRVRSASLRPLRSATGSEKSQRPPRISSSLQKFTSNMHLFFKQELDITYMGLVMVMCFFISGLIDSVAFNSWSCFVGMQTGNTVFAGLGISGQPKSSHTQQWIKSLVSIGSFCLGTLFFNAIHRWPTGLGKKPSSLRRSLFVASFLVQTAMVVIAAVLVSLGLVSSRPFVAGEFSSGSYRGVLLAGVNYLDLCPIALLAFQSAGQVCLSRVLSVIELPSIVLSTLFHDFTADLYEVREAWRKSSSVQDFITVHWRRQEKRLAALVLFLVGAIVGGEMYRSAAGMVGALWLAAGLKATIVLIFLFWRKDDVYVDQGLPR
ncbi:hypothetical protein DV735_g4322, partial [Chaetothyriales sp. CBS 134920]